MSVFLATPNNKFDLSALSAYGEVIYLTKAPLNPFNTDDCFQKFEIGLDQFDSESDYICMTGNLQLVAFMMMVVYKKFDTFRILMFDATHSNYRERVVVRGT